MGLVETTQQTPSAFFLLLSTPPLASCGCIAGGGCCAAFLLGCVSGLVGVGRVVLNSISLQEVAVLRLLGGVIFVRCFLCKLLSVKGVMSEGCCICGAWPVRRV